MVLGVAGGTNGLTSPAFVVVGVGTSPENSLGPGSGIPCLAIWAFNFFTTSSAVLLVNLSKKLQ